MKNLTSLSPNSIHASLLEHLVHKHKLQEIILWKKDESGYFNVIFPYGTNRFAKVPFVESLESELEKERMKTIYLRCHYAVSFKGNDISAENEFQIYLNENVEWMLSIIEGFVSSKSKELYDKFPIVIKELSDARNNSDFYSRILDAIIQFVPSADAGFFFLFDQKTNKLLVEAAIGYREESYRKTQLTPGEAITGFVFEKKSPIIFNGEKQIRSAMKSMTKENYQYYLASTTIKEFPNATLAVPLIFEGKALGVYTINGFKENAYFGDEILPVLVQLIEYVTLTYINQILVNKHSHLEKELELTRKALRAEHTQLQRTSDLYNHLASLISKNKGISVLMDVIYRIVKVPMSFFDELLMPISSVGLESHHVLPSDFLGLREVQYAISVKRWQHIKLSSMESMLVIPVIGAENVIGFFCVWIEEEKFYDGDRLLLEYSASMIGLELMKMRTIEETQRSLFGEIFEQLIEGKLNESVLKQAQNLGFSEKDYYAVLVCEVGSEENDSNLHFLKESWMKWIQQAMKIAKIHGLVTQHGTRVIAFLSMPFQNGKQEAQEKLVEISNYIGNIPFDVRIGIGRFFEGFISVKKSYIDAQQCLKLLVKKGEGKVLRFADGGIYRLLLNYDRQELELYVSDYLGPLLEKKKDLELLYTLITYVNYNGDLSKVTNALTIHHNTLYYRLKRIEDILGVTSADHEEWFDITIACKIYSFLYY